MSSDLTTYRLTSLRDGLPVPWSETILRALNGGPIDGFSLELAVATPASDDELEPASAGANDRRRRAG